MIVFKLAEKGGLNWRRKAVKTQLTIKQTLQYYRDSRMQSERIFIHNSLLEEVQWQSGTNGVIEIERNVIRLLSSH